ncbi:hypothetical protein QIU18_13235 [Capnocytophaga canimorsus]|nr:hypothetical protein [Capnocytophaga canimorsus]WGU68511.1 hypothetical protein QIU19_00310 [Capnocytophaga canimorsus]WGU70381.1 hypothetical protein QIU18_13235 [Capnocytophaga canimorsus]
MKHLEFYSKEIAQKLKAIKGISSVIRYNDGLTLHFSFWFENYEVFNEIERQLPPNWYVSFTQRDKIVVLKYNISQEQNDFFSRTISDQPTEITENINYC